ncbi:P-loop containing nucleoside triphosphate hydrolases superfamily protein [Artemisia annua]|uniref:P-loop containing nucleoside triphosphate hydrolases superfamily protein n=1 Tax=Artemisia annua TaxID=35608 RepID=A0A2U1KXS9_ARTAN|nr:P-loop containing nucleoside triphosphate hydrolases superfamily protein [Artemisia annua]
MNIRELRYLQLDLQDQDRTYRIAVFKTCRSILEELLIFLDLAVPRGHVWVIGAKNAGKSTLINALAKKGGVKVRSDKNAASQKLDGVDVMGE